MITSCSQLVYPEDDTCIEFLKPYPYEAGVIEGEKEEGNHFAVFH